VQWRQQTLSALWLRMVSVSALYLAFFAPSRLCVKSFDLGFFNRLLGIKRLYFYKKIVSHLPGEYRQDK
jgi:hypothetical protein